MLTIILERINTKIINFPNLDPIKIEPINPWIQWSCSWWWFNLWPCKDSLYKTCSDKVGQEWDPWLDKVDKEIKITKTEVKTLEDKTSPANNNTNKKEENKFLKLKIDLNKNQTLNLPFKAWKKIFRNLPNMTNKNNLPCWENFFTPWSKNLLKRNNLLLKLLVCWSISMFSKLLTLSNSWNPKNT